MNLNNFKWIEVDISLLLLFGIANPSSNAISNLTIVCVAKCCFELRTLLTMLIRSLTDNPKRISMRKQKLEKTRAKTRDIPNEKKTESLTTKARIRRKERERQRKKRNVNGVVHMCSDRLSTEMIESKEYFCGTHWRHLNCLPLFTNSIRVKSRSKITNRTRVASGKHAISHPTHKDLYQYCYSQLVSRT